MDLRAALLSEILSRFAQHDPVVGEPPEIVRFRPRHPDFGDVIVLDDGHEATVWVGVFTHFHATEYEGSFTDEQLCARVTEHVLEWLEALFDDRVLAWGSHEGGGGCAWFEPWEPVDDYIEQKSGMLWSGPWQRRPR